MLLLSTLSLFLDLRAKPQNYEASASVIRSNNIAPGGILYSSADDIITKNNGLQQLEFVATECGSLLQSNSRVGVIVAADTSSAAARNAIHEAIRRPEQYLALLDDRADLFDFALATAQHCRRISGCKTTLMIECRTEDAIDALHSAALEDEVGVPLAAVLAADASLWSHALRLSGGGTGGKGGTDGTSWHESVTKKMKTEAVIKIAEQALMRIEPDVFDKTVEDLQSTARYYTMVCHNLGIKLDQGLVDDSKALQDHIVILHAEWLIVLCSKANEIPRRRGRKHMPSRRMSRKLKMLG